MLYIYSLLLSLLKVTMFYKQKLSVSLLLWIKFCNFSLSLLNKLQYFLKLSIFFYDSYFCFFSYLLTFFYLDLLFEMIICLLVTSFCSVLNSYSSNYRSTSFESTAKKLLLDFFNPMEINDFGLSGFGATFFTRFYFDVISYSLCFSNLLSNSLKMDPVLLLVCFCVILHPSINFKISLYFCVYFLIILSTKDFLGF